MQAAIYELLLGYGPHYPEHFGPDMQARLGAKPGAPGSGLISAVAVAVETGAVVAHACTIFDPAHPSVGLFGAVFTDPAHRQRGLSSRTVRLALQGYDAAIAAAAQIDSILDDKGGASAASFVVLGTGSPHAARTYQKSGFGHLAGGLDGKKGYNPEDLGEWIMIRAASARDGAEFNAADYYSGGKAEPDFVAEPLSRAHWAELVLLFNSFEGAGKLAALGIDDGLESEEKLCTLMNECESVGGRRAVVARHTASGRVCGCAVSPLGAATSGDDQRQGTVYIAPGCEGAAKVLDGSLGA